MDGATTPAMVVLPYLTTLVRSRCPEGSHQAYYDTALYITDVYVCSALWRCSPGVQPMTLEDVITAVDCLPFLSIGVRAEQGQAQASPRERNGRGHQVLHLRSFVSRGAKFGECLLPLWWDDTRTFAVQKSGHLSFYVFFFRLRYPGTLTTPTLASRGLPHGSRPQQ